MFVDTHCHLNIIVNKKPDQMLEEEHFIAINDLVKQAFDAGVTKILNVGTSLPESINSIQIAQRFESVYATIGIHPCDANELTLDYLKQARKEISTYLRHKEENKIVAIGETGLDFFHKPYNQPMQIDFFKVQIELALEYKLPLIVHVRESADEVLTVLDGYRKDGIRGVIHCFLQQKDIADTAIDWGFYIGLDAPITYPKNEWLRDMFREIPLDSIILETDSPFLPPQHLRGKQNLPSNIPIIAQALADLKQIEVAAVAQATTANVLKLFGI